ncbi:MAG: hypothetical protein D6696_17615, partial [Acidobacteria bacterium]
MLALGLAALLPLAAVDRLRRAAAAEELALWRSLAAIEVEVARSQGWLARRPAAGAAQDAAPALDRALAET